MFVTKFSAFPVMLIVNLTIVCTFMVSFPEHGKKPNNPFCLFSLPEQQTSVLF